jgi:hypothetical protein
MLRNPTEGEGHVSAPRGERCRRRHDRRQGRERAGHQRSRQRKREGHSGWRRVVRAGYGAAAVRLGLRDNSLRACARFGGSVHRTVATARATGHARLRRGLPARALGPSSGGERESDDEGRRASEQQFHDLRMHGCHTGVNPMGNRFTKMRRRLRRCGSHAKHCGSPYQLHLQAAIGGRRSTSFSACSPMRS